MPDKVALAQSDWRDAVRRLRFGTEAAYRTIDWMGARQDALDDHAKGLEDAFLRFADSEVDYDIRTLGVIKGIQRDVRRLWLALMALMAMVAVLACANWGQA